MLAKIIDWSGSASASARMAAVSAMAAPGVAGLDGAHLGGTSAHGI